jgi:hypothetical protein
VSTDSHASGRECARRSVIIASPCSRVRSSSRLGARIRGEEAARRPGRQAVPQSSRDPEGFPRCDARRAQEDPDHRPRQPQSYIVPILPRILSGASLGPGHSGRLSPNPSRERGPRCDRPTSRPECRSGCGHRRPPERFRRNHHARGVLEGRPAIRVASGLERGRSFGGGFPRGRGCTSSRSTADRRRPD